MVEIGVHTGLLLNIPNLTRIVRPAAQCKTTSYHLNSFVIATGSNQAAIIAEFCCSYLVIRALHTHNAQVICSALTQLM